MEKNYKETKRRMVRVKNVKTRKEIERAIKDYDTMPALDFSRKYGLEKMREAKGFAKALKWVIGGIKT